MSVHRAGPPRYGRLGKATSARTVKLGNQELIGSTAEDDFFAKDSRCDFLLQVQGVIAEG